MPEAAIPIPSATILLIRDGQQGLEVFMVVRHHQIDFASGALVFPGGKVDAQDSEPAWQNFIDADLNDPLTLLKIAAIRESFEECGVLLARDSTLQIDTLVGAARVTALADERDKLNAKKIQFIELVRTSQLTLASKELVHFAHWITPQMMPKRFDTHFFIAASPPDHDLQHDGYESVDSVWIRPQQALDEAAAGDRTIIFPTLRNLEKLSQYTRVEPALAQIAKETIVPVTPWTEDREEGKFLCIPKDAGYENFEQLLPSKS